MNIEKIKYFIDLVECKNFTETARKNFVSQTTISQQIASMESEFKNLLIDRKQIPIQPTAAGWIFYKEAKLIYKQYLSMLQKMNTFRENASVLLKIEYAGAIDIRCLDTIIPDFLQLQKNVKIELGKEALGEISLALKRGVYDLAVTFDSEFIGQQNITTKTILEGHYCAVVGKSHPLYDHDQLDLETLYTYPLVMLNPKIIGLSYDLMLEHTVEDGYEPNIERFADDVESELFYILTEQLIGFFPEHYILSRNEKTIKKIPIKDTHHSYRIQLAYLENNTNPALKNLIQYLDAR